MAVEFSSPFADEVDHSAPPLLGHISDIEGSILSGCGIRRILLIDLHQFSRRAPAQVGAIVVEIEEHAGVVVERHRDASTRCGEGEVLAAHGRFLVEDERHLGIGIRLGDVLIGHRNVAIGDGLHVDQFKTADHHFLAAYRHLTREVRDDRLSRILVESHISGTCRTLHYERSLLKSQFRHDKTEHGRRLIRLVELVEVVVLKNLLEISHFDMIAARCLPYGRIELCRLDVGEVDFLHIHQVESVEIEGVARLSRVVGFHLRDGGIGCGDFEGIGSRAMSGLHPDFIFQFAVEGGELEAIGLGRHRHDDAVVGVHHRIEIHLLVVDIDLECVVKVLTDDGDNLSGSRLGERAVGLCRVGHAHRRNLRCAAGRIVVGA